MYEEDSYLRVEAGYDEESIEVELEGEGYRIGFPREIWGPLDEEVKASIVDHVAFMATNYLPLVLDKRGVIYNTRLPMFDCFSFKSMALDLPSSAVLDGRSTVDYLRSYLNLDFVFSEGEPVVWSRPFEPGEAAVISFTSGKESLLTLALCRELGLEPILINVEEPSNTNEHGHKARILRELNEEFGVAYYTVPHEVGLFHDAGHMGCRPTSLGWGNQLMYYLFIHLPFVLHHRARYLFYGNEQSCDKEVVNSEGFRANFCYDQSSHWTAQQDVMMRVLTGGSARVGSLVGPLNEIAVIRCLHEGFPELARYQMSCFCEDPVTLEHRWCCNCSKCARNYAFIRAMGADPKEVGFWRDMFTDEHLSLFSALDGGDTYGFDRSGLGREEQELALFLAHERDPEDPFLKDFVARSRYTDGDGGVSNELLKRDYEQYFGIQEYPTIPRELSDRVYGIYTRLLGGDPS